MAEVLAWGALVLGLGGLVVGLGHQAWCDWKGRNR